MTIENVRLITIPFSHYCEKARWALERCGVPFAEDGHLPLLHYAANRRAGARRTVPVVVAPSQLLTDSTEIIAWADAHRPGTLLPTDTAARAEALALEDDFDRQLGPAARRWGYAQLLPRRDLDHVLLRDIPRWEARALRLMRPLLLAALKRGLTITPAGVARSLAKLEDVFARTSERLADGRRFLVGDRFTVADLSFASLAAPVLLPPGHPYTALPLDTFDTAPRAQITAWRESRAGAHALRMYRDERGVRP